MPQLSMSPANLGVTPLNAIMHQQSSSALPSGKRIGIIPSGVETAALVTFAKNAFGGALCCSATHSAVVPIDVVKTRMQLEPGRYKSLISGMRTIAAEEGSGMLMQGVGATAVGYALQGAFKFGFYEYFREVYKDYPDIPRYLLSAASAEFFADLALCPLEATRIRLVAEPSFAKGLPDAFTKLVRTEGVSGLYKGLLPMLFKQIPYTMTKFVVYESVTGAVYKHVVNKEDCSVPIQLAISLESGVIAGVASAIVSQPADTILSVVNKQKDDSSAMRQIYRIFRQLTWRELMAGTGARCVMVGALTAGQFFIYNAVKMM